MKTFFHAAAALLTLFCFSIPITQAQIYLFEPPEFVHLTNSPFLNKSPDYGPPGFLTSFTSSPNPSAFSVSTVLVNPSFSGQCLIDPSAPSSPNTLTVFLNTAISDVQLDFALFSPGHLELHSSAGNISAFTPPSSQSGLLTFHAPGPGVTQFDLIGFTTSNNPTLISIDNLQMTVVPEPTIAPLAILAAASSATRRRKCALPPT